MASIKVCLIPGWRFEVFLYNYEGSLPTGHCGDPSGVVRKGRVDKLCCRVKRGEGTYAQTSELMAALNRCIRFSLHTLGKTLISHIDVLFNCVPSALFLFAQIDGIPREMIGLR